MGREKSTLCSCRRKGEGDAKAEMREMERKNYGDGERRERVK